ncbi:hypothetical protein GCM10009744_32990 [Kribbella alba]|uniref:Uncharacterized protein n=1 Tax=Kribbella alba TaxID=190197 RepID=A0ABN2FCK1_9ACTN
MRKRLTVLVSAALMASVVPGYAQAATPSFAGCTASDFQTGNCLTAVVSGNTSPLEAAVSQAVKRGEDARARQFVASRKQSHHDAAQTNLEQMLKDRSFVQPSLVDSAGSGTVSGYIHTLRDTPTYLYCGPSNCTQVGKLQVDIRMNIGEYPKNLLSGGVDVTAGPVA